MQTVQKRHLKQSVSLIFSSLNKWKGNLKKKRVLEELRPQPKFLPTRRQQPVKGSTSVDGIQKTSKVAWIVWQQIRGFIMRSASQTALIITAAGPLSQMKMAAKLPIRVHIDSYSMSCLYLGVNKLANTCKNISLSIWASSYRSLFFGAILPPADGTGSCWRGPPMWHYGGFLYCAGTCTHSAVRKHSF